MSNTHSNPVLIKVRNLTKTVATSNGPLTILSSVDLTINQGDSLAILGASGSGKSTLLSLLAGLDTTTSGEVSIAGQELSALDEDGRADIRRRMIGFVFQSFQLLPGLTALENVMLPLELVNDKQARDKAQAFLQTVGLAKRITHTPRQLSGGEQQRVALARAFVTQPAILFADEPTGNLDSQTGQQIIDLLFELNLKHQTTLVLVTHDNALAQRCQSQIQLSAGKLI